MGVDVVVDQINREHPVLCRAGEFTVASYGLNFVFLHEEVEALGVLGHDLVLSLLDGGPVQLAGVHAFDTEFFGFFEVIPQFSVEKQRLGWDTADVQASAAEESVFFNERGLQAVLAGADGGGVSSGPAADNGDVINS